ncbi:hypothetical protein HNR60_000730 [Rhodopseudomonas rhenobacensis]|uniref:Uncharacterized protein n=1 Tax=Rhodopseudomonas rhenobacensis TaxID=87461 RepID=A0A7W7Z133_9BRAD|nr:hypothetical protein [Rhodopseudomonas rhenobacensis]MBB5045988.1 hypothetical protein [Rhodopseudomonas rhenobacensis]
MAFFNIDVLCTVSSGTRLKERLRERDQLETKTHRFGKQIRALDSPRPQLAAFLTTAFIFDERDTCMVNRAYQGSGALRTASIASRGHLPRP